MPYKLTPCQFLIDRWRALEKKLKPEDKYQDWEKSAPMSELRGMVDAEKHLIMRGFTIYHTVSVSCYLSRVVPTYWML